jgi:hypothetical protein
MARRQLSQPRKSQRKSMTAGRKPGTLAGERRVWLSIWVFGLMAITGILLSIISLKRLLNWLPTLIGASKTQPDDLQKIVRYADYFLRWVPFPTRGKCLCRSLVLYSFAIQFGLPVRLLCGVRRRLRNLEGHAWLTLEDKPFLENGHPEDDYVVTFSFPVAPPQRMGQ